MALDRARTYPWGAFVGFMTGALAEGDALLIAGLAGTFTPDEGLALAAGGRLRDAARDLLEAVQGAGALCGPTSRLRTSRSSSRSCGRSGTSTRLAPWRCAGRTRARRCRPSVQAALHRFRSVFAWLDLRPVRHPPGRDPPLAVL